MRRGALLMAALLVALVGRPAHADDDDDDDLDDVATKPLRFEEKQGVISSTLSFPELLDASIVKKLGSGFVTTIVVRAYTYRDGAEAPVALTVVTFRVAYDLWDEVYLVQIRDPRGELNLRRTNRNDVLHDMTTLTDLPLVPAPLVPRGVNHFLGVIIEVNPVSEELLAEVRRWLSRASGTRLGGADSFFGSFVSIFVNRKVAQADRVLRFRSQPFYRPRVKTPPPPAKPRPNP